MSEIFTLSTVTRSRKIHEKKGIMVGAESFIVEPLVHSKSLRVHTRF